MIVPQGWQSLPGGYVPPQQAGMPAAQVPQQGQPQQFAQAPQASPVAWQPAGQPGAPFEGQVPYLPPQQVRQQQPMAQPGQPMTVQQMQQQGMVPQQQWAPPAQPQLGAGTRLEGPGIPQELQGKTFGEAMQIYNGMRNVVLQQTAAPQGQPQVTQGQPQQPQGIQQPQNQQGQPAAWDWRAPEAGIARVVNEQLQPVIQAMQPIIQQSQQSAVQAARNQVAQEIGPAVFAQLEPHIIQRLQGATPQGLQTAALWRTAAESVIGGLALQQGRQQPQAQQPQTAQPQMAAAGWQPTPNLNGFFTEQPNVGVAPGSSQTLTPQQAWAAQAMGMDPATYMAWGAGGQRR